MCSLHYNYQDIPLYLDDILSWMVLSDEFLSILIQFCDAGLLGLQALADEVLWLDTITNINI